MIEFLGYSDHLLKHYKYTVDDKIHDEVCDAVDDYIAKFGCNPEKIILGYGTYFSLCLTVTAHNQSDGVLWLCHFEKASIVIDPTHEYTIIPVGHSNPLEEANRAFIQSRKPSSGLRQS